MNANQIFLGILGLSAGINGYLLFYIMRKQYQYFEQMKGSIDADFDNINDKFDVLRKEIRQSNSSGN